MKYGQWSDLPDPASLEFEEEGGCPWGCEMEWEEPYKYRSDGVGMCRGKCANCGLQREEELFIKYYPTPIEINKLLVMAVMGRYELARCGICGKILEVPVQLFPMDHKKYPFSFDLCTECFPLVADINDRGKINLKE